MSGDWHPPQVFLGVLGGMGPAATVDFLARVVAATPAARDQDHVPVVVHADPTTPDRSDAILGIGPDPLPALRRGIDMLVGAGCGLIAIPCNTAHHWHAQLQEAAPVPVLHIADTVIDAIGTSPHGERTGAIGVLATDGTVQTRIYHDRFEASGRHVIDLAADPDNPAMAAIRALKGGDRPAAESLLIEAADRLVERGADALVIACTDLSAVCSPVPEAITVPVWDAAEALAVASVERIMALRAHDVVRAV